MQLRLSTTCIEANSYAGHSIAQVFATERVGGVR